jgi:hypothetical protein
MTAHFCFGYHIISLTFLKQEQDFVDILHITTLTVSFLVDQNHSFYIVSSYELFWQKIYKQI